MKKVFCLLAAAALSSGQVKAQLQCGTDQVYQQQKRDNPMIAVYEAQLDAAIKDALSKTNILKFAKTTATTYDIPIVVHVIHDYGTDYLADNDIFEAAKYWDTCYMAKNADTADVIPTYKRYIGNPMMHLHLATIDPNGNPTKGITHRQSYLTANGGDQAKLDDWDNTKYINIWFINKFGAANAGAAAYAYYPSSGAATPYYDGVIALASYLNTEKTIPHEIGHVLNLQHPWGSTNNPGVACGDDGVADTPPTYGHSSCTTADLYDTRCAPHTPLICPDTANTQNTMDYSYCGKMFTKGQVTRMQAALTASVASRNNLYSASNLTATGALQPRPDIAPTPDFSVEKGLYVWSGRTTERAFFICQNSSTNFVFKNRSWNDTVTSVAWTFSNGATNPTSTEMSANVTNSFTTPGWVTVTLQATGNNTGSNTISRTPIYVASTTPEAAGYAQYFSSAADMAKWPLFNYYNNNFQWEYFTTAGYPINDGCVRYRGFDYRSGNDAKSGTPVGDYDDMFTPALDLSSYTSSTLNLSFYTSGTTKGTTAPGDSLQIFTSIDCGDTWVKIATLSGTQLINNGTKTSEYTPTSSTEWKGQTIAIPATYRTDKSFFRFRYWPTDKSNDLFFDNFTVSPWTTEIAELKNNPNLVKLAPNPTTGNTQLCFTTGTDANVSYSIRDITGKVVYEHNAQYPTNTFIQENIARSIFPSAGMYIVTLTLSQQTVTQKLIVE